MTPDSHGLRTCLQHEHSSSSWLRWPPITASRAEMSTLIFEHLAADNGRSRLQDLGVPLAPAVGEERFSRTRRTEPLEVAWSGVGPSVAGEDVDGHGRFEEGSVGGRAGPFERITEIDICSDAPGVT